MTKSKERVSRTTESRPAIQVAEQILWLRREIDTTPMHLLKLTFLAHGWMLGLNGKALVYDAVEAWRYGPVIPNIYHRYKSFGGDAVTAEPIDGTDRFSDSQQSLIEEVVEAYRSYTAFDLSDITHRPGTPWDLVYRTYGEGAIIPNELIRDYYRERAKST